jgi:hypothetical protein
MAGSNDDEPRNLLLIDRNVYGFIIPEFYSSFLAGLLRSLCHVEINRFPRQSEVRGSSILFVRLFLLSVTRHDISHRRTSHPNFNPLSSSFDGNQTLIMVSLRSISFHASVSLGEFIFTFQTVGAMNLFI